MLTYLFEAPRSTKRIISLLYDGLALALSFYLSYCLRLGKLIIPLSTNEILTLGSTTVISLLIFTRLGLYRAILRFMGQQALINVCIGVAISATILSTISFFLSAGIPRSVPVIYALSSLFFIGTPRLLLRNFILMLKTATNQATENVIIYGAGHSGFQLASALQGTVYKVVGFVDDNPRLYGTIFRGLTVFNPEELPKLCKARHISHILLALGTAPRSKRAEILNKLEPIGISIKTMPATSDILNGKAKIEDIKDVGIEDLLGRDPVQSIPELLDACIKGKNVLVTGAGGSIGSELCRQIFLLQPKSIVLFELNEYNLYQIEQELEGIAKKIAYQVKVFSLIGSVQSQELLRQIFKTYSIHTIYHAAAYKHVPLIEHNIIEGIKNNVFGTWRCAEAAIAENVESFVLVSTDKAVRPTNIMGASKRVAELILQAISQRQSTTRFTMVRFGNVLGSSGSVVPLFRKQLKLGGPITVTHPNIVRYFMTIPEAAELVLQAGSMGKGGEVFVLDMGDQVKILDLAKRMIHLSGLTLKDKNNKDGDIEIQFTGLRPGEKLYEELLIGENVVGTKHERIMCAQEKSATWEEIKTILDLLENACKKFQYSEARKILANSPIEFYNETTSESGSKASNKNRFSNLKAV